MKEKKENFSRHLLKTLTSSEL